MKLGQLGLLGSEPARTQVPLTVREIPFSGAKRYVVQHHRHHVAPLSHKFSLGVYGPDGELHGVAVVGRPVGRRLDDGTVLEVTRVATDGTPNACSALYGAARREVFKRYPEVRSVITYTREDEPGTSLRAVGWTDEGLIRARSWAAGKARPRQDTTEVVRRRRWRTRH